MAQQILQVNFRFNVARKEYENICSSLTDAFAAVPGCSWKIWLMNESAGEAGGIYLFKDETSVEKFKGSQLVSDVLNHPALSDIQIKQFDVLEDVSRTTRAPLAQAAAA